ncbi:MAG: MCE family protein [Deltaproteobacteria bacterium]|nr:MCE family protein [Deltaproteobacteria bacterium]
MRVGLFAAVILVVLGWATIRVSDKTAVWGGGYELSFDVENATGLKKKAPVELAGVAVGVVKDIELVDSTKAKVLILVNDRVKIAPDSEAVLRTRGFLGETYVELLPGSSTAPPLEEGGEISKAFRTGDVNGIVAQFSDIAGDIKAITANARQPTERIVANLDEFTAAIKELTVRNTDNIDEIAANMAELTRELRDLVAQGKQDVQDAADQISSITGKIDRGEGTVGKLVNDEGTVEKLNDSLDNLNSALGGFRKLETEFGFHTEYLTTSEDFKNYINLALRPTPDKAVLLGLTTDPNPNPSHVERTTDVTVGGTTTRVTTDTATIDRGKILISAQLAKSFYDFTLRGGLIESKGGAGVDLTHGPFDVRFSAFDFSTRFGERPHLKLLGDINLTQNIFLVGGADDMLNPVQKTDYFFGAGFRFVDDDFKKLASMSSASSVFGK